MPTLWNLDHQAVVLDWNEHVVVQAGASHDFTDEEVAAGLAGHWGEEDPRSGLEAEREFKKKRDAAPAQEPTEPAESGDKE